MDQIFPAYLTPGDSVQVSGVISNLDAEVWQDLQVYLVMSQGPMTTRDELTAALDSPATEYSGTRVTVPGLFLELGSLDPGASVSYELDVPFDQLGLLSTEPGVYSIGVHVIGTDANDVRDPAVPTGRARSYIPLMPQRVDTPVDLSLVWPFQAPVERAADGAYVNEADLVEQTDSGGQLRRKLDMALAAGDVPLTVVADPAVLDALAHLADGSTCADPPRAVAADASAAPEQVSSTEFLRDFAALADNQTLWSQWYGRPDPAALTAEPGSGLRYAAERATTTTLKRLGLSGRRVYLPVDGLHPDALPGLGGDTVALVDGDRLRSWQPEDGPVAEVGTDAEPLDVLVADSTLSEGGPEPGPTDTALQVRQRILAESALLSLQVESAGSGSPGMVFVAAPTWDPGPSWPSAGFFTAFDAPWLRLTSLEGQLARGLTDPAVVPEPVQTTGDTLPSALVDTAASIASRGRILRAVTGADPSQRRCYDQAVALAVSEYWRGDATTGQELARAALAGLRTQLAKVSVEAPEVVTLSSSSGSFPVTITNNLEQPVTVGVRVTATDGSMTFADIAPVELRRNESTTLTVRTRAADVGVIGVTAKLTTPSGRVFGEPASISLRTSVVGVVVWVALAAAAALMGLAVVRRLRRRGRPGSHAKAKTVRTSP